MFYSDVIDMLCLYIQQSLFDLLQNSINELLCLQVPPKFFGVNSWIAQTTIGREFQTVCPATENARVSKVLLKNKSIITRLSCRSQKKHVLQTFETRLSRRRNSRMPRS